MTLDNLMYDVIPFVSLISLCKDSCYIKMVANIFVMLRYIEYRFTSVRDVAKCVT